VVREVARKAMRAALQRFRSPGEAMAEMEKRIKTPACRSVMQGGQALGSAGADEPARGIQKSLTCRRTTKKREKEVDLAS
jgi:hypothetical protein